MVSSFNSSFGVVCCCSSFEACDLYQVCHIKIRDLCSAHIVSNHSDIATKFASVLAFLLILLVRHWDQCRLWTDLRKQTPRMLSRPQLSQPVSPNQSKVSSLERPRNRHQSAQGLQHRLMPQNSGPHSSTLPNSRKPPMNLEQELCYDKNHTVSNFAGDTSPLITIIANSQGPTYMAAGVKYYGWRHPISFGTVTMQLRAAQKIGTSRLPKKAAHLTQPLSRHCHHFKMLLELLTGISQVVNCVASRSSSSA